MSDTEYLTTTCLLCYQLGPDSDDLESQAESFVSDLEAAGGGEVDMVAMTTGNGEVEEVSVEEVVGALAVPREAAGGNLAPRDEYYFYQCKHGQQKGQSHTAESDIIF